MIIQERSDIEGNRVFLKTEGEPLAAGESVRLGGEWVTLGQPREETYKGRLIRVWAVQSAGGGYYSLSEILQAQ